MTMVSIGAPLSYPDYMHHDITAGLVSMTFDTATDRQVFVFRIPASGNIDNVHYRITASTSPILTMQVSIQTVDATSGLPTGTMYKSHTPVTTANPTTGNKVDNVAIASAVAGDQVALVFDLTAYTSGSFGLGRNIGGTGTGFPYRVQNTAAADTLATSLGSAAYGLEYPSNVYYPIVSSGGAIVATQTTATVNNATVTRRGNIFTAPFKMRCVGAWVLADLDGDCTLEVYNASTEALLATATHDKDVRGSTSAALYFYAFDAAATITLDAGGEYYVVVTGQSATNSTMQLLTNIPENGMLDQLSGGKDCYSATFTSPTWSTSDVVRYAIGIMFDQVDDGTGAGAGGMIVHPGMSGRMSA